MNYKVNSSKGITLIEMITVIGITTLLLSGLMAMIIYGYEYQRFSINQVIALEDARRIIETMNKEMRNISQADDGAYAIADAQDQSLTFYADIDSDLQKEKVRYYINGTDLKKEVIEPQGEPPSYPASGSEEVLTSYVANGPSPLFIYYDENYTGTENPLSQPVDVTDIRLIQISLDIDVEPTRDPEASNLESEVQLRNLKTNL